MTLNIQRHSVKWQNAIGVRSIVTLTTNIMALPAKMKHHSVRWQNAIGARGVATLMANVMVLLAKMHLEGRM